MIKTIAAVVLLSLSVSPAFAAPKPAYATANAQANALAALVNGGSLVIYSGTQPATPETALSGNTACVTITLPNPAFGSASNGVVTLNGTPISSTVANNCSPATWYRVYKSDGTTTVWDGTVGTSGADLNLATTTLGAGASLPLNSLTYTVPGY